MVRKHRFAVEPELLAVTAYTLICQPKNLSTQLCLLLVDHIRFEKYEEAVAPPLDSLLKFSTLAFKY
jgi:hypothetical protein